MTDAIINELKKAKSLSNNGKYLCANVNKE